MEDPQQRGREADRQHPYPKQETEELADEVIARINPDTNELESLEVLFFSTRLEGNASLELPVEGNFRLTSRR